MDITNIILYQILGCLKAFKNGHYRYNENASFSQNVKDYIFRHHITYGTGSDYVDQLEKEDKKHLGAYTQNIIHEMLVKNRAQL